MRRSEVRFRSVVERRSSSIFGWSGERWCDAYAPIGGRSRAVEAVVSCLTIYWLPGGGKRMARVLLRTFHSVR